MRLSSISSPDPRIKAPWPERRTRARHWNVEQRGAGAHPAPTPTRASSAPRRGAREPPRLRGSRRRGGFPAPSSCRRGRADREGHHPTSCATPATPKPMGGPCRCTCPSACDRRVPNPARTLSRSRKSRRRPRTAVHPTAAAGRQAVSGAARNGWRRNGTCRMERVGCTSLGFILVCSSSEWNKTALPPSRPRRWGTAGGRGDFGVWRRASGVQQGRVGHAKALPHGGGGRPRVSKGISPKVGWGCCWGLPCALSACQGGPAGLVQ